MMIKVFRINTGSCGGCDLEIAAAVSNSNDIIWAEDPAQADILLLTGPLTNSSRPLFLKLWSELGGRIPLFAVGRCAIDGHPFGRGGLIEVPEVTAHLELDGCPVSPQEIASAIRTALQDTRLISTRIQR